MEKDVIVQSLGLNVKPSDLVVLVTKDALSCEEMDALDPVMDSLTEALGCMMVVLPQSVYSDLKVLDLHQLLSLRDSIDEAITSKMSTTNVPTA